MNWISIWNVLFLCGGKKKGLWTFSTRGDVAYQLNSRVLCPAAHWAAVGVSVCPCPPVCLPFLPVHSLLFSPFLIIPQGTREDWLNWTWLSVSDWWLVCCLAEAVSLYANLSTFAAVCLSVCPAQSCLAPPRPAQPSPPSLYDCQTVCRPASDCCSVASYFVLAMLPPLSSRWSACTYCSFHPQLVSPSFVIFNWRTHPHPHKMNFPLFPFFESQGNSEIRKWFIGRQNFHRWMVILENSFPACRRLIAHLILRVFFGGEITFPPAAGARWKSQPNEKKWDFHVSCIVQAAITMCQSLIEP